MKTIRINFVDLQPDLPSCNDFLAILQKRYNVVISNKPDYLFYGVFGNKHLDFQKCIRIFYTGECITPNFNECDYAIGFDRLEFGGRYVRMPLYSLFQYRHTYESLVCKTPITKEELAEKKEFCSFVVSNGFAQEARAQFFHKLCEYKLVNSGGRFLNNIGGAVANKLEFQAKHKFCICFENNSYPGYTTEKLVEAFASRTIPIYWGDPTVCEDFNEDAFINVNKYASFDEVVERVKEIDNDDEKYLAMINAPIIKKYCSLESLEEFLYNIVDQELSAVSRRPHSKNQHEFEEMLLRHRFFEDKIYFPYKRFRSMIKQLRSGTILSKKRTK